MAISTTASSWAVELKSPATETSLNISTKITALWNGISFMRSLTDARRSRLSMSAREDWWAT